MTLTAPQLPPVPSAVRPDRPPAETLRRSAEALESAFLAEMLKSAGAFRAIDGLGGGGEGEGHFASFLADEQARAMVARGGIGLADAIEQALRLRAQGAAQ